ncbi:MAG: hypothetical protein LUD47_02780 [Clostridia bacterium]|nr:hypothetical protein [Clostridia bacterium]
MAEERKWDLDNDNDIDRDKDYVYETKASREKRYEVVTGEDGESELVLHVDEEEAEEPIEDLDDLSYGQDGFDDDDLDGLTEEQIAEEARIRQEEERQIRERVEELTSLAADAVKASKYAEALECVDKAEELSVLSGDMQAIRLVAQTSAFTDFTDTKKITETAKNVKATTSDETKDRLRTRYYKSVKSAADSETGRIDELKEQNETAKQSRREILAPQKKKAAADFYITVGVFAALAIVAIVFASIMNTIEESTYIIVTIVFGAAAVVTLVVLVIMARHFAKAVKMCSLNEKNSSTKLGRELTSLQERYEAETACCEAMTKVAPVASVKDGEKDA